MIVTSCKSFGAKCPCLYCENLKQCTSECDTDEMCEKAREYCESVNGKGEKDE